VLEDLDQQVNKLKMKYEKETEKYIFFWNGIFSQWYQSEMVIDGITYNCCEQYMMHQKALTFNDHEIAEKVMKAKLPNDQKSLGRQVKGFNKDLWDRVCVGIVYKGNYAKFTQSKKLKDLLLETGEKIIVEASPYDQIWGIGMGCEEDGIEDPVNWKGLNLLGWSIMLVRNQIK
jgi:ribA/ribD-fused uncharacterized protein